MKYLFFAATFLSLSSCLSNKGDTCQATVIAPALGAAGPKTVAVNQPAAFVLRYQIFNGCGKYAGLQEASNGGDTRLVGVGVRYDGCVCTQVVTDAQATYTFQPTQAGTYYLKFATATGYLIDTLVAK